MTTTKCFHIKLPLENNTGGNMSTALCDFQDFVLAKAGGCTTGATEAGLWRHPETGQVFKDRLQPFEIACDCQTFEAIVIEAFRLFPDQAAIYTRAGAQACNVTRAEAEGMGAHPYVHTAHPLLNAADLRERLTAIKGPLDAAAWELEDAAAQIRWAQTDNLAIDLNPLFARLGAAVAEAERLVVQYRV